MDRLPLVAPPLSPSQQGGGKVVDAYKTALATAASAAAYIVLARSMARELLPDELRAAARWGAAFVRTRLLGRGERERHTLVIRRLHDTGYNELFDAARAYLGTRIDPCSMRRLCLVRTRVKDPDGGGGCRTLLCMEPGGTTVDVFDGVEFKWTLFDSDGDGKAKGSHGQRDSLDREYLELSFNAEHADLALDRYVPFVLSMAEDIARQDRSLKIYMNEGRSWYGIVHHAPATFATLAMDPDLKRSIVADLDRFLQRKDYYRRIGKAWKRGYLLYGPPGTGKSSLVAAMANHLRFHLYDLRLSEVYLNSALQRLLIAMPNKSILVIEDIDCCFDAASASREDASKAPEKMAGVMKPDHTWNEPSPGASLSTGITLSGLLNFIDGLWSTCGEERILVFTTNYKDRLEPALLRPGRMDMHVYMGYCGWEAFKAMTLNYFLVNEHPLFREIQELLAEVEVTPAEVSEMLLRSQDDVDVALRVLSEFLQETRRAIGKRKEAKSATKETEDKDVADRST